MNRPGNTEPAQLRGVEVAEQAHKPRWAAEVGKHTESDFEVQLVEAPTHVGLGSEKVRGKSSTSDVDVAKETIMQVGGAAAGKAAIQGRVGPGNDPRPKSSHGGTGTHTVGRNSDGDGTHAGVRLGHQGNAHVSPHGGQSPQTEAVSPQTGEALEEGIRQASKIGRPPTVQTSGGMHSAGNGLAKERRGHLHVRHRLPGNRMQKGRETVEVSVALPPALFPGRGPLGCNGGRRLRGTRRVSRRVRPDPCRESANILLDSPPPTVQAAACKPGGLLVHKALKALQARGVIPIPGTKVGIHGRQGSKERAEVGPKPANKVWRMTGRATWRMQVAGFAKQAAELTLPQRLTLNRLSGTRRVAAAEAGLTGAALPTACTQGLFSHT